MTKRTASGPLRGAALKAQQKAATKAPVVKPTRSCGCGCGETTKGGEFAMGHDARHKSNLIKEALAGNNPAALAELERRNWTRFLDKKRQVVAHQADHQRAREQGIRIVRIPSQGVTDEERARINLARINLMKTAAVVLRRIERYGRSSGERQILLSEDAASAILDASHPDLDPAERRAIKKMPEYRP